MSNFQSINDEEIEQDELKEKLDLITIASAKNLDNMNDSIIINGAVNNTQNAQLAMTATSTLRTYAETTRSTVNGLTSLTNTHETEINALQSSPPLFTDCIKFKHTGFFAMDGLGDITGSAEAASTELTTGYKRIIPNITDTYSSNIVLTDSNTKFIMNENGTYLCSYSLEIYDNASDVKIIQFGLHDDINGVPKFNFRNTIHPSGTGYEYYTFSGSCILTLTTGNDGYYFQIKSSGGGKLSTNITTEFTLIKINKSF